MTLFIILASIHVVFLGAVYGRLDGGGIAKTSEWIERTLIMFFFVLACAPFAEYWALLAYAGVLGIATGHGQYFLDRAIKAMAPESFDFIVRLFFGEDPRTDNSYKNVRDDNLSIISPAYKSIKQYMEVYGMKKLYWRNVFGMGCTGFLVGLPAAILAIVFGAYLPATLFLLTGPIKSIAYMVGYKFWKATEPAEYINGGLRNVICMAVMLLLLL